MWHAGGAAPRAHWHRVLRKGAPGLGDTRARPETRPLPPACSGSHSARMGLSSRRAWPRCGWPARSCYPDSSPADARHVPRPPTARSSSASSNARRTVHLRGALHFDESARAGADHVHVGLRRDVLDVFQSSTGKSRIEIPTLTAATRVAQRYHSAHRARAARSRLRPRPRRPGDRRGAGAAVGPVVRRQPATMVFWTEHDSAQLRYAGLDAAGVRTGSLCEAGSLTHPGL